MRIPIRSLRAASLSSRGEMTSVTDVAAVTAFVEHLKRMIGAALDVARRHDADPELAVAEVAVGPDLERDRGGRRARRERGEEPDLGDREAPHQNVTSGERVTTVIPGPSVPLSGVRSVLNATKRITVVVTGTTAPMPAQSHTLS